MQKPTRSPAGLVFGAALLLSLGPALLPSLACSTTSDGGAPQTELQQITGTVGRQGGKVELPGTGKIVLPEGAVDDDVTVGMEVVEPPVPLPATAVSDVVAFTPFGLELALPAKITLSYHSDSPAGALSVLWLPAAEAEAWEQVGGTHVYAGSATFEVMELGYYAVVDTPCTPIVPPACDATCDCCGTAVCVDVASDPGHCGACGNACGGEAYCSSEATCVETANTRLCDNHHLLVILGELPDLGVVSPEQTTDPVSAQRIAEALEEACHFESLETASQATGGLLDPCTDAPLQAGGTTDLVVGGGFTQRIAGFLQRSGLAPYRLDEDATTGALAFLNRDGHHLVDFWPYDLNPSHDYFVVALVPEPERGALILDIYGVGWEGTPAAVFYFTTRLLPEIADGSRAWGHNLLVEWTDDGDGEKDDGDSFVVLARDE